MRLINEAAVKRHALACSKACKAGKFTRVGEDFYTELEADVEAIVREVRAKFPPRLHEPVPLDGEAIITGELIDKLKQELNLAFGRLIQRKVESHPSCGVTLGRSR